MFFLFFVVSAVTCSADIEYETNFDDSSIGSTGINFKIILPTPFTGRLQYLRSNKPDEHRLMQFIIAKMDEGVNNYLRHWVGKKDKLWNEMVAKEAKVEDYNKQEIHLRQIRTHTYYGGSSPLELLPKIYIHPDEADAYYEDLRIFYRDFEWQYKVEDLLTSYAKKISRDRFHAFEDFIVDYKSDLVNATKIKIHFTLYPNEVSELGPPCHIPENREFHDLCKKYPRFGNAFTVFLILEDFDNPMPSDMAKVLWKERLDFWFRRHRLSVGW